MTASQDIDENAPLLNPVSPDDVTHAATNDIRGAFMTSEDSEDSDSSGDGQNYRTSNRTKLNNDTSKKNNYDDRRNSSRRSRTWDRYNSC